MSGHKGSNGQKTYRCSGKKAEKKCSSHIILEKNLVNTVFVQFNELISNIASEEPGKNSSSERLDTLKTELSAVEKLMQKKKNMYEADVISIEELISSTDQLRAKQKELQNEIDAINQSHKFNNDDFKFIADNIDTLWLNANDHERKQLMSTLFSQLVIDTKDEFKRSRGNSREIIIVSAK